jgi:hypothetical protein
VSFKDESIFAMDSFPKPRKRKIIRVAYPTAEGIQDEDFDHKKTVLIDFDRTIHKYSEGWVDGEIYDPPFDGAKEALEWLRSIGFTLIIFTARLSAIALRKADITYDEEYKRIEVFLKKYEIPYDIITAEKYPAAFYIDDRAVHIDNGDWDVVRKVIEKRLKYQQSAMEALGR